MARRRGRRPERRYEREEVYYEDEYYEDDDYYVERRRRRSSGAPIVAAVIGIMAVLFIAGVAAFFFVSNSPRPRRPHLPPDLAGPTAQKMATPPLTPVKVSNPKIDLQAVEKALWSTKATNKTDFKGWMKSFENEVNAIYFATLKRQNPNADATTLMPIPVRVEPKRVGAERHLHLYGYINRDQVPGYQKKQANCGDLGQNPCAPNSTDKLLFVFKQDRTYDKQSRQLSYALYDSSGYYYRSPGYTYSVPMGVNPYFLGFFMYPAWYATWYRPSFVWFGTPGWYRTGFFYNRYSYYYGLYPGYRAYYGRTYYTHYRPWGWRRGAYFRSRGGRYYYRRGYGSARYRSRYRGRYRRNPFNRGYRNRGRYRGRYRSRYRNRFNSGYRRRGYGGGYRSRGGKW